MVLVLATSFLAQRSDRLEGAVFLGIVVLSALASAGKWIVQKIAEKREQDGLRRQGMPIEPPRTAVTIRGDDINTSDIPPFAAPVPAAMERTRKTTMKPPSPVMERVMEVLLEKAAGTELERRIREVMPQQPAPPPPPAARSSESRTKRQSAQRTTRPQKPARSITIAEREASRDKTRQTEVERETQRLAQREQRFTEDTDQRLGRVETHITAQDVHESMNPYAYEISLALDDSESARRAFILSEVLAPPMALRTE